MSDKRYDLGILFVHGIGDHQQGSTLLQFGEPVIETFRRWYMGQSGLGVDAVRIVESVLLPAKNFSTDPAHSIVEFDLNGERKRWLLAEDWWGDQVVVPDSREFMTWMLTRGSWVVLLHLVERLIDSPRRNWLWRMLARALTPPLWTVTALALQVPLLGAYLLTLVPIPSVSRWVTILVRSLTSVLGDSFVLVKLESQRSAILTHFIKSLEFVQTRSELVAVVAHSQGTAVVCDVLRTTPTLRPRLLVTFGSGVAKLDQLYLAEASRRLSLTLAGFAPAVAAAFAALVMLPLPIDFAPWLALTVTAAATWMGLTAYVLRHIVASRGDLDRHYLHSTAAPAPPATAGRSPGVRLADHWVDFYATCDPVPSASLRRTFSSYVGLLFAMEVQNRRSYFSDHTSYFGNFAQFVLPLCRHLAVYGGTSQPLPEGGIADKALTRHHLRMVRLFQWSFWITLLAVPVSAPFFWPVFERWGGTIWSWLDWRWVPDWASALASWLWPASVSASIPLTAPQWNGVLAAALGIVATLLYRPVFGGIWEWWNLQSMESSVQYDRVLTGIRSFAQLVWLALVASIPLLTLWLLLARG